MLKIKLLIALQFLTWVFFNQKLLAQYDRQVDSLVKQLTKKNADTTSVKILNDLGGYMIRRNDDSKTIYYLNKADSFARAIGYLSGILVANNRLGIFYQNKNDHKKCRAVFDKALEIARQTGNKKGQADVISNLGISYSHQGEYARSLESYMEALKIRKEIKDTYGINSSVMSIANLYYLQSKYDKAIEFYQTIIDDKNSQPEKYFYAQALYNSGLAYVQLKDYKKAMNVFNQALIIDNEIDDKQGVALVYSNMGSVNLLQQNYPKALEFLKLGLNILTELDDKRGMAEAYGEMGQIYDSLKQPKKAEECFDNMLSLSQEIQSLMNERKAYLFFSNHFMKQNDFRSAYEYFRGFKAAEDSMSKLTNMQEMAELQAQYETERKETEIKALKADKSLKESENRQRNLLIIGSFVFIAILSFTIFLFYNRRQLKKKSELEKKNYELEKNALSAQMNPHFIFNSLASISGFISENDKEKATEYLGVFSRLIRHNLEQSREALVAVEQEARMLRSYLYLEQLRFNNKFDFEIEVDKAMDDSIAIPPMFIQPFVENAVLHGVAPLEEGGHIKINFKMADDSTIECQITDNGVGISQSKKRRLESSNYHQSLAMTITMERMEIINSRGKGKIRIDTYEFIKERDGRSGTNVKISFPSDYI